MRSSRNTGLTPSSSAISAAGVAAVSDRGGSDGLQAQLFDFMLHIYALFQFAAQLVELPFDGAGRKAALGGDDSDRLILEVVGISDYTALAGQIGERLPHAAHFVLRFVSLQAVGRRFGNLIERNRRVAFSAADITRIRPFADGINISADVSDAVARAQRTVDLLDNLRAKLLRFVVAVAAFDGEAVELGQVFGDDRVRLLFFHLLFPFRALSSIQ